MNTASVDFSQLADEVIAPVAVNDWSNGWTILPIDPALPIKTKRTIHRLNSLGKFFYFTKVTLRKHRLTTSLHLSICNYLEKDHLKEVLEIPRDHFKSTICSEGAPIWWALPFNDEDEGYMRTLGYSDEWIRWMKRAHNRDTRTLLVSANIKNAGKIGRRIHLHYHNNDFFKSIFPEIMPTNEPWAVESMTHKRSTGASATQGEGTYDFLGVGAALQSRHYDRVIQDDLVGLDALESPVVMEGIIDYHKLLVGAYDSIADNPDELGDEIVVGNRWQYEDLNSHLRENEPSFHFTTHSAIGGCCDIHPYGTPIFPEEFSLQKLEKIRERLGTYFYSCQYLNSPVPKEEQLFKESYLNFFHYERFTAELGNSPELVQKVRIVHHVKEGQIFKDILPSSLRRVMVIDPNHAGVNGRSRHAIAIIGFQAKPPRMYLLEMWAEAREPNAFVDKIFEFGAKWKIKRPHVEEVGFQKFLKYHLELVSKLNRSLGKWTFDSYEPLKANTSLDAKTKRIEGMEPVYRRGEFFCSTVGCERFLDEYRKYPNSNLKDSLDTIGHALTLWGQGNITQSEINNWLRKTNNYGHTGRSSVTGY